MRLTEKQFNQIKNFVREQLSKNDAWHGIFHTEQTVKMAMFLAKKEKADIQKCIIIAWLHDIAKKSKGDHGKNGAIIAKKFLLKIKLDQKDIEEICYAIDNHNKTKFKKTKEAKIIYDSDKLQTIGPYGLLRDYGLQVFLGQNQVEAYEIYKKEENFYFYHLCTKTGKRIAKEKFKFMKKFNKHYKSILNIK